MQAVLLASSETGLSPPDGTQKEGCSGRAALFSSEAPGDMSGAWCRLLYLESVAALGKRQTSFLLSAKYPSQWELWQAMIFFPNQGQEALCSTLCPAPCANECLCPSLVDLLSGMQGREPCCPGLSCSNSSKWLRSGEGRSTDDVWRS